MLNNSNCYDNKKNTIENIVSSIVNCKDGIYMEEIYAKNQAEESVDFDLVLSTEINAVERGHGIVIWKKHLS